MAVLSAGRDTAELSPPIPINNTILSQYGIKLRKRQLSIVASAPGVGKSLFARNIAAHTRLESLYFSADSDEWTVMQSVLAILTNRQLLDVEHKLDNPEPAWTDYFNRQFLRVNHVDWAYSDGDIDIDYILRRVQAHEAVWDMLPEVIYVDNVLDAVDDEDYKEVRRFCRQLRKLARTTEAHVMGLHHVNGRKEDGDQPIRLSDLLGKLGKVPEVVLGLSKLGDGKLMLTVPKNRGGPHDLRITLPIDYSTGYIGGFVHEQA